MDQTKIKKARKLIYKCFIWKTREKTLYKKKLEDEVIERSIYNYTKANNNIILVSDSNGKIGNDENGITNGDTSITANGRRISSMVRTLKLDILNKHAKC